MTSEKSRITVLLPEEGEPWSVFARRMQSSQGELLVILPPRDRELAADPALRDTFLTECKKVIRRLRLATKQRSLAAAAREKGIRTVEKAAELRRMLEGHEREEEAIRVFSPHIWSQQLKSQLQSIGLLSLPRLRIFLLVGLSAVLFSFVVFRLLPSAEIVVHPRKDSINQTANVYLALSGATVDLPQTVRQMPLIPLTIRVTRTLTFDQISKEFTGTPATLTMGVLNKSDEMISLRKGTRFVNQAGMVFRIQQGVVVYPDGEATVKAVADPSDLYGQILGERGNVPPGLRWDIPGLPANDQKVVYGENRSKGEGGTTAYRTVLKEADLAIAKERLEQELEASAKQMVEEEKARRNAADPNIELQTINIQSLIRKTFVDFSLPTEFLGQAVESVPVEGTLEYAVIAYDARAILRFLSEKLVSHVREGKELLRSTLTVDHLDVRVIYYDDAFRWVKLTVDLTASEQYVLDPLSPTGALFGKRVREKVIGMPKADAMRIVQNMPEVERAEILLWPPWHRSLPGIPSQISIVPK